MQGMAYSYPRDIRGMDSIDMINSQLDALEVDWCTAWTYTDLPEVSNMSCRVIRATL